MFKNAIENGNHVHTAKPYIYKHLILT